MTHVSEDQAQTKKRNTFTQQPDDIYDLEYLSGPEISVWLYLNTHSNRYNPTLNEICKKSRFSKPTCIKAINSLEKMNMLKVIRGKKGNNKDINKYFTTEESLWKTKLQVKESTSIRLRRVPRSGKGEYLDQVKESTDKNNKENNNKNNNVKGGPVYNFENPYTKEEFKDIFELINPIHGRVHPEKAGCIAKYYIRLLKKNEVGTLNLIDKYRQGVKNGCEFDKSIRLREGHPIFDTSFKKQFEKDLEHAKNKNG